MSWRERIKAGLTGTYHTEVDAAATAHMFGNPGVHVLATCMAGLYAERALNEALLPLLPEGFSILGIRQQTFHRAPARISANVAATAIIRSRSGNRIRYDFRLETADGVRLADGDGESVLLPLDRFLRKAGAAAPEGQ